MDSIFYILVLIISVVVHEVAHGYVALRFGDQTAKMAGRLTLNPLPHLDVFGSVILPVLLVVTKAGFLFGWAKPVPVNPNNFYPEERKRALFFVSIAGIVVNFIIALFFAILIRISNFVDVPSPVLEISALIVFLNILLAIFNAMPIPPLDGSGILFSLLPSRFSHLENSMRSYSLVLFLLLIFFVWPVVYPIIIWIFTAMTGVDFNL